MWTREYVVCKKIFCSMGMCKLQRAQNTTSFHRVTCKWHKLNFEMRGKWLWRFHSTFT
jgi:hypothetical protein